MLVSVLNRYYIPLYCHQRVIDARERVITFTRDVCIYIYIYISIYIYTFFFCFFSFRSDDRGMKRSTRSRSRLEVRPASFERANVMVPTLLLFEDGITTRKKRVSGDFVGEKGRNYSFLSVLTIAYQRRSPKPRAASDPRIHDRWTIQRAELFVAAWLVPPFSSSFPFFFFIFFPLSFEEDRVERIREILSILESLGIYIFL